MGNYEEYLYSKYERFQFICSWKKLEMVEPNVTYATGCVLLKEERMSATENILNIKKLSSHASFKSNIDILVSQ